jgi:hypothetical protein
VVEYGIQLLEAQPAYLIVFAEEAGEVSALLPFFRKLERVPNLREAALLGGHPLVERMLRVALPNRVHRFEQEQALKAHVQRWPLTP